MRVRENEGSEAPASVETPTWIVFDWGDVLVRYRPRARFALAERLGVPLGLLVERLQAVRAFDRLGTGHMTPAELLDLLEDLSGVRLDRRDLSALYAQDVADLMPGARALVSELAPNYRLGILSNTFFGHWDHLEADPFYAHFDARMASHTLGVSKPAAEIYRRALAILGTPAGEVAFVDDKIENVEAARALGIRAVHSTSVEETRAGLRALGVTLAESSRT